MRFEMDFVRNEKGDPCELADDGFQFFGIGVQEWMSKFPPASVDPVKFSKKRMMIAIAAKQKALEMWSGWDWSGVIEHYRIDKKENCNVGELDLFFVFKRNNNGDTIVVRYTDPKPFT